MADDNLDAPTMLTHVNDHGEARMVDVGAKPESRRTAVARGSITMNSHAAAAIRNNELAKGDCLQIARIAAIQATKWTSHLIPLCHAIPIDGVKAEWAWKTECELEWIVTVSTTGKTGVEMEALTAATVALLTVYDMCKSVDKSMTIQQVFLESKSGGTKGDYRRPNSQERNVS